MTTVAAAMNLIPSIARLVLSRLGWLFTASTAKKRLLSAPAANGTVKRRDECYAAGQP